MAYVDTNVVIAYAFERDPNHERAKKLISMLGAHLISSPLTLVELHSVLLRRRDQYKPLPEFRGLRPDMLVRALVKQLRSLINLEIRPDTPELNKLEGLDIYHIYSRAVKIALEHNLNLRTLDLLHLAYATKFHEEGLIEAFITLDNEILERRDSIEKRLGLKIIG
jgi:predicted nucleic acid-binding protein